MYKILSQPKTLLLAVIGSTLLLTGNAFAKGKPEKPFAPGKPGEATILDIALLVNSLGVENEEEGVGEFDYLYGAVSCLEGEQFDTVYGLLTGEDKYTLFAPTNEAFRKLQRALTGNPDVATSPELSCAVNDILENDDALFTVLAYHLTEGRRFANSVFNRNQP
ncbi:MAG: fasciclin domain-containing protein, partial [Xanthomonadales bacterium]